MASATQVVWDDQAQPQVKWDDEQQQPPSLWDKTKAFGRNLLGTTAAMMMPSLPANRILSTAAQSARQRSDQAQQQRLADVAQGKPSATDATKASAYDLASRAAGMAAGLTSPKSQAITGASLVVPELTMPALVAHGAYTAYKHARGALAGNPEEAQAAIGGLAEAAGGAAGTEQIRESPAPTLTRRAVEEVPSAIQRTAETLHLRVPEAPRAMQQAIQPGVNIPRAAESIDIAGPRLQQVKNDGMVTDEHAEPLAEYKGPADILQGVKAAKRYVYDAISKRLGPVAEIQVDTSPIADAMEQSISGRTERQFPQLAAQIRQRAATYRDLMPMQDLEDAIQDANGDLRNFYKQPATNDSPVSPSMRATEAEVDAARRLLDDKVQKLSGNNVADLKREYGALRDVERAAARQSLVRARQKGAPLYEALAALRAAGDLMSGNVLGAAQGAGSLVMGRWLAKLRDPNFLINQAFQGKRAFSPAEPIPMPAVRNVRGLMGRGSLITPITDVSGPAEMPIPQTAEGTRATRLGLLLPESTGNGAPLLPSERGPQGRGGPNQVPPAFEMPAQNNSPIANAGAKTTEVEAPAGQPEPTATKIPVTSRSEALKTYYSLPQEARDYVDSQISGMDTMPQILREARMEQLSQFGGKGTPLKERLAQEAVKDHPELLGGNGNGAAHEREPGDDEEEYVPPKPEPVTPSVQVRIREMGNQYRRLMDQSAHARSWPRANLLIRRAKAIADKVEELRKGQEQSE